jgi:hypothetical protein
MADLTFTHSIHSRGVTLRFSAKPDERIRSMLKGHGFRWEPREGVWWRRRVEGAADFLTALDRAINPDRPDGPCWKCNAPAGFFRQYGAATPVYCAACHEEAQRAYRAQWHPDPTDLAYEDACARACGL